LLDLELEGNNLGDEAGESSTTTLFCDPFSRFSWPIDVGEFIVGVDPTVVLPSLTEGLMAKGSFT
jgi:hypothetical protein